MTAGVLLPLPWSIRMKIAFGAAKGLAFLHEAEKPVIYRDFKTSNILLDSVGFVIMYFCLSVYQRPCLKSKHIDLFSTLLCLCTLTVWFNRTIIRSFPTLASRKMDR